MCVRRGWCTCHNDRYLLDNLYRKHVLVYIQSATDHSNRFNLPRTFIASSTMNLSTVYTVCLYFLGILLKHTTGKKSRNTYIRKHISFLFYGYRIPSTSAIMYTSVSIVLCQESRKCQTFSRDLGSLIYLNIRACWLGHVKGISLDIPVHIRDPYRLVKGPFFLMCHSCP